MVTIVFGLYIALFACIIAYLLNAYPMYKMYKLANLKNPWIAFVPIVGNAKMYNLANFSMWLYPLIIVVAFIPIVGFLVSVPFNLYLMWKCYKNFGFTQLESILSIPFSVIINWYIALTNKPFIGEIDTKYTNN